MSAVVLLLAGCGHASAPKDPFIGTWSVPDDSAVTVVIARSSSGYVINMVVEDAGSYPSNAVRHGNQLVGEFANTGEKNVVRQTVLLDPQTGRMHWVPGSDRPFDLVWVSDSTTVPTASQ